MAGVRHKFGISGQKTERKTLFADDIWNPANYVTAKLFSSLASFGKSWPSDVEMTYEECVLFGLNCLLTSLQSVFSKGTIAQIAISDFLKPGKTSFLFCTPIFHRMENEKSHFWPHFPKILRYCWDNFCHRLASFSQYEAIGSGFDPWFIPEFFEVVGIWFDHWRICQAWTVKILKALEDFYPKL